MRYRNLVGALLLIISLLLPVSQAMAAVWTDHYDVSNGYSAAGEGISTITFDDWGYIGPGGRTAKNFAPINGFGPVGQRQHVVTLWPDRLTPEDPQYILKDMTNSPAFPNTNMDAQVNFYKWGYTSPGYDRQSDYTAYRAADYSASVRKGSLFNNMLIDLDGDYLVDKNDMHFNYYEVFSYVDATGVNPSQDVQTSLSFQPYPVSNAIGWCGSILASHPVACEVMAGQLTFDFAMDVYYGPGPNRTFMGTQIVPAFEMRSYGTLSVHVWAGSDLQTFTSDAVINNTNPNNKDRWDVDPNYYNNVSFAGGGVLPDGAWISADSYNADGSHKLNPDGTWNVTVVPAGTPDAVWHDNAFKGYAFILRADALRVPEWYDASVYGPDPCTNKNCDDGNPCTTDSCVGGVCLHKPVACPAGQKCDPASGACAPFDFCAGVVCNDNNACTTDTCDPATGCVFTPVVCNDGNACTTDTCNPATGCVFTPIVCNDNNACTTDTCNPATGCVYTPNIVCNDNNKCTIDTCNPVTGACVFTPKNCDDGNSCTIDSCNTVTGNCVNTPTSSCSTVSTTNNNFTMNQPDGTAFGGSNDVRFTWDGTRKTSVASSGQVANATLSSSCPFFGTTWSAHDVAIYGPGTYTVYSGCPAGSPGCGMEDAAHPSITFTVNDGEIGGHMLFDWNGNLNIDVVDVWTPKAAYSPSPLWTGACGPNPTGKVWDWMSRDVDGDGVNGYPMVDGPFKTMNANFNVMGIPVAVNTTNNNFTMNQPDGTAFGGSNDVRFTWDGTRKTSVAEYGQISNATLSSSCPFFGTTWSAHDVAIYGPGTYTVYSGCPAGSPGCGIVDATHPPITFTVYDGEIGGHMLFDWNGNLNIDVVDVWTPQAAYDPSPIWTGACGPNPTGKVWDWMSRDVDGDGVNGYPMVDGPFKTMNANFNVMGVVDFCRGKVCNDNNACTDDACDPYTGQCVFTPAIVDDGDACTVDSCNPATGVVHTPVNCDDNNACTTDSCDPAIGCLNTAINCDDGNACTADTCDPAAGCKHAAINCDDGNLCTTDSCDTATGCIHAPVSCPTGQFCSTATGACISCTNDAMCDDSNACTTDSCVAGGCIHTAINCDDNNACTTDTCNPATGCVHTAINCDDHNPCTTDSCDPATGCKHAEIMCLTGFCDPITGTCVDPTILCNDNNACTDDTYLAGIGCVHTPIICDDHNLCTVDSCNPAIGCVYTPILTDDGNACTVDSCDPATGTVVHTPKVCNDRLSCTTDACDPATGQCVFTDNGTCPLTFGNNFTMIDPGNKQAGGTNDVVFAWDGTLKTKVECPQESNATISSSCSFFGVPWKAHDVAVYGRGTYTVYTGCPAGCPNCGLGAPITFIVHAGEIGIHMLFDWNGNLDIDVVNVMKANAKSSNVWTGGCGSNAACTVWNWMSYDFDGDGINGAPMVDGPFPGMNANFNLGAGTVSPDCCTVDTDCNDNNACTTDTCLNNTCVHTPIICDDHNACTADSCSPATGCAHTPIVCNDNNLCTIDTCDTAHGCVFTPKICVEIAPPGPCDEPPYCNPATGNCVYPPPINCDDNNACTIDSCNLATGCVHTPIPGCCNSATECNDNNICTTDACVNHICTHTAISCDDGNVCTTDSCNTVTGCVHTLVSTDDHNACTTDSCDPVTGVKHMPIICNDNNACTIDTCDTVKGCVFTPINCADGNACTTDGCNTATGCTHTAVNCNDGNACTIDSCNTATGCVHMPVLLDDGNACTNDVCNTITGVITHTQKVCNDNNTCTTDSCNTATGACVFTPVPNGTSCTIGIGGSGTCQSGTCQPLTTTCPRGSYKKVTLIGTGSNNWWTEYQIMTEFAVSGSGCILRYTAGTITVTPGTVLKVDWREGWGPQPTSVKWKNATLPAKTVPYTITCPTATGSVGSLVLSNTSGRGGKDSDTLTVSVATN